MLTGIAVVVGWLGVYFAFQGHWLGIAAPLRHHGAHLRGGARGRCPGPAPERRTPRRARRVGRAQPRARAAAPPRRDPPRQQRARRSAAGDLRRRRGPARRRRAARVALVVEEGRFLKVAAATGPLARSWDTLVPVDDSLLGVVVSSGAPLALQRHGRRPAQLQDARARRHRSAPSRSCRSAPPGSSSAR